MATFKNFGYDREKELVRIFIPQTLHSLFVSLNESNEILIKQIENGIDNIQIIYPEGIKPTRKNVLDNKYLNLIVGGVNMFASNPIPNYTQDVDNIVDAYTNLEYVDVPAETLISILKKTGSAEQTDFDSKNTFHA